MTSRKSTDDTHRPPSGTYFFGFGYAEVGNPDLRDPPLKKEVKKGGKRDAADLVTKPVTHRSRALGSVGGGVIFGCARRRFGRRQNHGGEKRGSGHARPRCR